MNPPATVTLPPEGRGFRHRDRVTLAGEATVLAGGTMRWIVTPDGRRRGYV